MAEPCTDGCWIHSRKPALSIRCSLIALDGEAGLEQVCGWYDEENDEIVIDPNEPPVQRHITLLHEILHRIELRAVRDGVMPERLLHDWVRVLSIYLLPNLIDAGVYRDPPDGVDEVLRNMAATEIAVANARTKGVV